MKGIRDKVLVVLLITILVAQVLSVLPTVFAEAPKRDTNWVPSHGSYVVENDNVKFQSDSGYDLQGPNTIVDGFNKMQAGTPDFVYYGEYEYISINGGTAWNQLPSVRTLTEVVAGKEYLISFVTTGTALEGLTIQKRVTILPDEPLARIDYSISSTTNIASALLYYAIDYDDSQTTGDLTDNVYSFSGSTATQVFTSQWLNGIYGLYVDTLASGFGVIRTDYPADYYAGYWNDALYRGWGLGYSINSVDDGIGVKINLGALSGQSVQKNLYIGIYQAGQPPPPIPPGKDVTFNPDPNLSLTFEEVTVGGSATCDVTEDPPEGFLQLPGIIGPYYNVEVTATFLGNVIVAIHYDDTGLHRGQEKRLRLCMSDGIVPVTGDVNGDGQVNVRDLVIVAIALGSKPGKPHWNPAADLNHNGRIDVCDLAIVLCHWGDSTWVDITMRIDTVNNIIYGETDHFSGFGVH